MFQGHAVVALMVPWFDREPMVQLALQSLAALVVLNVIVDYARVWFTCPGHPDRGPRADGKGDDPSARWCDRCDAPKPERAHHCSSCGCCVLKMDHHCDFVNNCIGLQNYKVFVYFLLDVVCAAGLQVCGLLPQVIEICTHYLIGNANIGESSTTLHKVHVVVAFGTASVTLWMVVTLLFGHVQQILCNSTTIDEIAKASSIVPMQRSQYDMGALNNVAEVFGEPPRWCRPLLDWSLRCARFWMADEVDLVSGYPARGYHDHLAPAQGSL